LTFTDITVDFV